MSVLTFISDRERVERGHLAIGTFRKHSAQSRHRPQALAVGAVRVGQEADPVQPDGSYHRKNGRI